MSSSEQAVQLQTQEGLPLRLRCNAPAAPAARAAIVVCHGFKGFAAWGFFPYLRQRLSASGLYAVGFDFSRNGVGEDPAEFTRLDLFAANTYSQECRDLAQVLRWLREESPMAGPSLPIGLLGHSRASIPVLTVAAEQADIGAIITWNGVSRALRVSERQLAQWERDGRMEFTNARTGQRMVMDFAFAVDALEHRERFDPVRQAQRSLAPHLIVHGAADLAVDPEEGEELRAGRSAPRCELVSIAQGSHTFGAVHPFAGSTPALEAAIQHSIDWCARWLVQT